MCCDSLEGACTNGVIVIRQHTHAQLSRLRTIGRARSPRRAFAPWRAPMVRYCRLDVKSSAIDRRGEMSGRLCTEVKETF